MIVARKTGAVKYLRLIGIRGILLLGRQ